MWLLCFVFAITCVSRSALMEQSHFIVYSTYQRLIAFADERNNFTGEIDVHLDDKFLPNWVYKEAEILCNKEGRYECILDLGSDRKRALEERMKKLTEAKAKQCDEWKTQLETHIEWKKEKETIENAWIKENVPWWWHSMPSIIPVSIRPEPQTPSHSFYDNQCLWYEPPGCTGIKYETSMKIKRKA